MPMPSTMTFEPGQRPGDEDLRRRVARLDERESRLARRERDVRAREHELECGRDDRRMHRALLGAARLRWSGRAIRAGRGFLIAALALWLMAFPLVFAGEYGAVRAAALIAGAALAFLALVRARVPGLAKIVDWALGATGTWLLAWGGLSEVTPAGGWALAATGAVVWALALAPLARHDTGAGDHPPPHTDTHSVAR
jgi:hypothetical protein